MSRELRFLDTFCLGFGCMLVGLTLVPGCSKPIPASKAPGRTVIVSDAPDAERPVCTKIRASGEAPLVDDFEVAPNQILTNDGRSGWWFGYDDGTGGKLLREELELSGSGEKGRALHVVSSGFVKWGAGFGANIHPQSDATSGCAYDASAYSGLRVRARGRGRLRMTLGDAMNTPVAFGGSCTRPGERCHDRPGVWLNLEDQWRTFEFPFCAFLPEGWGGSTEGLDPSKLFGFHFRVGEGENGDFWLDDLAFYRAAADAPAPRCGAPCPLDAVPHSAIIDPFASNAPLSRELSVHVFEQATKSCGSIARRYLSYVPNRLPPRSSAPVLIMLHGSGANAESARYFMARDRFDELAARDGFIVVYGNAAPGLHSSPDPRIVNSGAWRQAFFDDGQLDDVDYLERVLGDLTARGIIDGNNTVFLTGISNGGGMVLEAARRLHHRVRGVAALMPYDGDRPKPVPDLSGTKLKRVLFAYTLNDPGMADGYHETLAPLPAQWATAMGLPPAVIAAPQKTSLPDVIAEGSDYQGNSAVALATRNSRVTQFDRVGPNGEGQVRVLVLDRAGHFWPNPTQFTEDWVLNRWGFRNQDFDAADMVWDFLRTAKE
jgi:poly(3-hydroxybutyrate) depolymerase